MPKVTGYNPGWLARPHPGFQLFNPGPSGPAFRANGHGSAISYDGADRTIARRGSEVFVVVGKHIRWADLPSLKDQYAASQETPTKTPRSASSDDQDAKTEHMPTDDSSYRTLRVPIGEPIRQLRISPNQNMMAITTSHTAHIALLPPPELLNASYNREPLKLKTYTLGPTTHVLSQTPIVEALWHPLGSEGCCLVTVTVDAVVRVWEFDRNNRWSADKPALAVDLRKLALADSEKDDVAPNESTRNRGFSSDAVGMDVASACFGGQGSPSEDPWAASTLWVAMTSGDIYALCPLLPSRFESHPDLQAAFYDSVITRDAATATSAEGDASELSNDLKLWITSLDSQPLQAKEQNGEVNGATPGQILNRPKELSAVPRLQGPFQLHPDPENLALSDIFVIPARRRNIKDEDLSESEADDELAEESEGLSASIVCLATREGRIYVCLNNDGVMGQWLPKKAPRSPIPPSSEPSLVVLEALETLKPGEDFDNEWPTFTADIERSRHSFFVTHSHGVYHFSMDPWLTSLEKELESDDSTGVRFRLDLFRESINTARTRILSFNPSYNTENDPTIPACLVLEDSDLGYFLLTAFDSLPQAAMLERPRASLTQLRSSVAAPPTEPLPESADTMISENAPYAAYEPSPAFFQKSALPSFSQTHVPARHKQLLTAEIRLSTATLDIFTEAHRVLSRETHQLGTAAADLFRRCEKLLDVLRNQILRVGEVAEHVEKAVGTDGDEEGGANAQIERRIERARQRSMELKERYEEARRKLRGLERRDLSLRERQWVSEIERVGEKVIGRRMAKSPSRSPAEKGDDSHTDADSANEENTDAGVTANGDADETEARHLNRFKEVQKLSQELLQQAKDLTDTQTSTDNDDGEGGDSSRPSTSGEAASPSKTEQRNGPSVPAALKQKKTADVMRMLEKEAMLIQLTQRRLEELNLRVKA